MMQQPTKVVCMRMRFCVCVCGPPLHRLRRRQDGARKQPMIHTMSVAIFGMAMMASMRMFAGGIIILEMVDPRSVWRSVNTMLVQLLHLTR